MILTDADLLRTELVKALQERDEARAEVDHLRAELKVEADTAIMYQERSGRFAEQADRWERECREARNALGVYLAASRVALAELDCAHNDPTPDVIHCPPERPCAVHRMERKKDAELKAYAREVHDLRASNATMLADWHGQRRAAAERQREACAKRFDQKGAGWADRGNAEWVRATPLVTDAEGTTHGAK